MAISQQSAGRWALQADSSLHSSTGGGSEARGCRYWVSSERQRKWAWHWSRQFLNIDVRIDVGLLG